MGICFNLVEEPVLFHKKSLDPLYSFLFVLGERAFFQHKCNACSWTQSEGCHFFSFFAVCLRNPGTIIISLHFVRGPSQDKDFPVKATSK